MRLLIIEDEEDFVRALAHGLRREGYAVDVALDGSAGVDLADINDYDVLILDLNLPEIDGIEVFRRVRQARPRLPILMLTARAHPVDRIAGLDLGADDYLIKPFHFGELCARLRALLRRDAPVRDSVIGWRDFTIDLAAHTVWKGNQRLDLTNKEFGILEYLVHHPGAVVTQEDLLEHVWDINTNPFTTTVRVHMNTLRRKLGGEGYIETVIGAGYRLVEVDTHEQGAEWDRVQTLFAAGAAGGLHWRDPDRRLCRPHPLYLHHDRPYHANPRADRVCGSRPRYGVRIVLGGRYRTATAHADESHRTPHWRHIARYAPGSGWTAR